MSNDAGDRVFAVLVNWCNDGDTLRAVESLLAQSLLPEVVVVDNASPNGSEARLREALAGRATVLQSGANLGWAGGCNVAIRYALALGARYVWLFNNDATAHPTALAALVDVAERHPDAAACGSLIYEQDRPEVVWFAGGAVSLWRGVTWHIGRGQTDRGQFGGPPRPVAFLTGCSLLVRRAAFERVGLLPEKYFLYFEDVDWCLQARRRGYRLLFVPEARVWHREGSSARGADGLSPTHAYYDARNNLYFIDRWCSPLQRITARANFAVRVGGKVLLWSLLRRPQRALIAPLIAGVHDFRARKGERP
ncbi:glycosyltransferase family 2 protein [Gloeobacter violaceus]|uniref:Gll3650 protein n=1 Tax=Gloeobacter violaceus (strain ATCC 29082 / PCC 7421) TaxID=251221 RepID=Q7NF76_GLOVI|nr:glycosyltransferase family 2 protein [Gloeobacter violaceus]BAC91591.1 gll3650 [Gloeobacter violaceus PCC 7421]